MRRFSLEFNRTTKEGTEVFYIICKKYGTVGVVEGFLYDSKHALLDDVSFKSFKNNTDGKKSFHVSWLFIEPFFRLEKGFKILMYLLKKELPLRRPEINQITYNRGVKLSGLLHKFVEGAIPSLEQEVEVKVG